MPEVDAFQAPQGGTLHERLLEAITEAFAGNGITNNGDALATADTETALGVDVSGASGLRYDGDTYGPDAASFTLSQGPSTTTNGEDDRRADLLYFDPTDGTDGSFGVLEGDPHPNPEPPATPDDGLMVAVIDVEHEADDVVDDDIINWRAFPAVTYPAATAEIQDGAVTTSKIDDGGVTTAKIATDAVTSDKIADDAVTTAEVADDAIGTSELQDGSVVRAKIGSNAVGTGELGDGAVTTAKLNDGAVVAAKIGSNEVGTDELADGSVTDTQVADDADVDRSKLDRDQIVASTDTDTATSNDDVYLVDTSGGSVTVTLSTDDVVEGRMIQVIDVGGEAGSNEISVDTEGDETIDGDNSYIITNDYGGIALLSDGGDWFTAGGGTGGDGGGGGGSDLETQDDGETVAFITEVLNFGDFVNADEVEDNEVRVDVDREALDLPDDPVPQEDVFDGEFTGEVGADDERVIGVDRISPDEGAEVYKASLTTEYAQAVGSGVDLLLVEFDNSGGYDEVDALVEGDGSTVFDRVVDDPIGGVSNTGDVGKSIGVLVENTSGASATVFGGFVGRTGLPGADEAFAQMLSRSHQYHPATRIEAWAGTSARKSQMLARRQTR